MSQKRIESRYADTGLTSHMEDYLETIYVLSMKNRVVRVKDIARHLEIKMPSVTAALNKLRQNDLIDYEKYGFIELTEEGKKLANQVYDRHNCLSSFFEEVLNLDCTNAENVACRVEHALTPDSCVRLHNFLEFFHAEEKAGEPWIERLRNVING